MEKVHNWIINHDDRWSFILLYVGSAVALSVFLNLFWVAMLMLGHFAIEIWRHVALRDKNPVLKALWCVKLDIALLLFSLVIVVYADAIMGALGLGQTARAGTMAASRMAARFAIIERAIKVFFLTIDDFARVGQLVFRHLRGRKEAKADQMTSEPLPNDAPAHQAELEASGLSGGDKFSLGFGAICAGLILSAPAILGISYAQTFATILRELHP